MNALKLTQIGNSLGVILPTASPSRPSSRPPMPWGIARNHPFVDGDKRTACVAMELLLALNGHELGAGDADCVLTMPAAAAGELSLETAVDRSPPPEPWRPTTTCAHDGPHPAGETATHPIEPPSATLAALRILAMAHANAAVRALPARPMAPRSGASNCRF
jgi:hypothetical protein